MSSDPASLDHLHDLAMPGPVPWWPPAPGWYVLAAVILLAGAWQGWRGYQRWRGNRYRRAALRELAKANTVAQVAEVLRRTALSIVPRETIANLSSTAWTNWLVKVCAEQMPPRVQELLSGGLYSPQQQPSDQAAVKSYAAEWIRLHQNRDN
jgi:hypothetical protein